MKIIWILFFMLFGGFWANTAQLSSVDTAKLFYEINKNSSLDKIRLAIQKSTSETMVESSKENQREIQDYLRANGESLQLLQQAASMPPVDFSCYNESVKPEIIPFISQIPKCIRLLMLDFEYNLNINKGAEAGRSLIAALRIDNSIARIPYIYGQLLRSSNILIIYQKITAANQNKSLHVLNENDLKQIILFLDSLEKNLSTGYQLAFQTEGKLKDVYIKEYLEPKLKTSTFQAEIIIKYKLFLVNFSESFLSSSPDEWEKIMNEAKSINGNFTAPVLTPLMWRQRYLDSVRELETLQKIFQAQLKLQ